MESIEYPVIEYPIIESIIDIVVARGGERVRIGLVQGTGANKQIGRCSTWGL
jgi:hypothetical protein